MFKVNFKWQSFKNTNFLAMILFLLFNIEVFCQSIQSFDIVVYGGTSSGITAAIQSSRLGKKVLLIEPGQRIGGLTTGGLGQTDIGNKQAIGGISREFYQNIKSHYQKQENWTWQKRESYKDGGQTTSDSYEDAMWTFEPSAALKVFKDMISKEKNITLVYSQRLNRKSGVKKSEEIIHSNGKAVKYIKVKYSLMPPMKGI